MDEDKRAELQAEFEVCLKSLVEKGRIMGTKTFVPLTVYVSTNDYSLIVGNTYHEGTIGRFDVTDKMLELDSEGKPSFITKPSHIEKSNISITDKWLVVITDPSKLEQPKPNKSPDLNLKQPKEMEKLELKKAAKLKKEGKTGLW